MAGSAATRWHERLHAWAIPEEILVAAPESPYGYPAELFRRRARRASSVEPSPTTTHALAALTEGGAVLDVGCGSGATSLPLAAGAGALIGVDEQPEMLAAFREAASAAGLPVETVEGRWPDVAASTPVAEVAVCGHVLYNVAELAPFARALGAHASRRVVLELTDRHPLAWMHDLWLRFHGLARPDGPTSDDAADVLEEMGLDIGRAERLEAGGRGGFAERADAIGLVRRRLCLPADRDEEIAESLGDRLRADDQGLWNAGPHEHSVITLWWDTQS